MTAIHNCPRQSIPYNQGEYLAAKEQRSSTEDVTYKLVFIYRTRFLLSREVNKSYKFIDIVHFYNGTTTSAACHAVKLAVICAARNSVRNRLVTVHNNTRIESFSSVLMSLHSNRRSG